MNKLILIMVLLFSATATAENIKYKRDTLKNSITHIRCVHMATNIELSAARIDSHLQESLSYSLKAWKSDNPEKESMESDWVEFYTLTSLYQKGWVDGFFTLSKVTQSDSYYSLCEDDKLLFSLKAK